MHLISYVESETGAHFLPPTSWVNDEFTWLYRLDGRHYARIASLDYGDQDGGIDLQTHDLAAETDLAGRLDALAVDRVEARRAASRNGGADRMLVRHQARSSQT